MCVGSESLCNYVSVVWPYGGKIMLGSLLFAGSVINGTSTGKHRTGRDEKTNIKTPESF